MLFWKRVVLKSIVFFLCLVAILVSGFTVYDYDSHTRDLNVREECNQRVDYSPTQHIVNAMHYAMQTIFHEIQHCNVESYIARCKSIWFCQFDSRWNCVSYGNGTIGDSGCGVCAATVLLDCLLVREETPDIVSNRMLEFFDGWQSYYLPGAGTIHSGMVEFLQSYDLNVMYYDIVEAMNFVYNHQGESCIYISSRGPFLTEDGSEYWTEGHIVAAYLVDDDYVYVQDSGRWDTCNVRYTRDQFASLSSCATALFIVSR